MNAFDFADKHPTIALLALLWVLGATVCSVMVYKKKDTEDLIFVLLIASGFVVGLT